MVREYPEKFSPIEVEAAIAANRFGYGARPFDLELIGEDARGWLAAQLLTDPLPEPLTTLPDSREILTDMLKARRRGRTALRRYRQEARRRVLNEAATHLAVAANSPNPFVERLVRFWTDHFTVSMVKPAVMPLVTAFEREAIRPNLFGSFYNMLHAVVSHPAMLIYLDNVRSVGPSSPAGHSRNRGLNENLARELLELHTVGEAAGFSQLDVRALAEMLTGWTVGTGSKAGAGGFVFRENWHQPGPKLFLNRTFPSAGLLEGEAALDHLARSPVTGRFLSHKMVRAFVADETLNSLASSVYAGFFVGGGRVDGMAERLIEDAEAWAPEQRKVKSPTDLVLSTARALDLRADRGRRLLSSLRLLGQPPYQAPSPAGWPQAALAWISPETLLERIEWCAEATERRGAPNGIHPADLGLSVLGPQLKPTTHRFVQVAATESEGLSLLFASSEFQRR